MKKQQTIAFLLSAALTIGDVFPIFAASNDKNWANETGYLFIEQRITGIETDPSLLPEPNKAITRAEFLSLLVGTFDLNKKTSISFSDVNENDWFYQNVAIAVGNQVINGFNNSILKPNDTITKAQAAVMICNAKKLEPDEATANQFTDANQIPVWAKGAIGAAVKEGYLSLNVDGSFNCNQSMTRAEAISSAKIVVGLAGTLKNEIPQKIEISTNTPTEVPTETSVNTPEVIITANPSVVELNNSLTEPVKVELTIEYKNLPSDISNSGLMLTSPSLFNPKLKSVYPKEGTGFLDKDGDLYNPTAIEFDPSGTGKLVLPLLIDKDEDTYTWIISIVSEPLDEVANVNQLELPIIRK